MIDEKTVQQILAELPPELQNCLQGQEFEDTVHSIFGARIVWHIGTFTCLEHPNIELSDIVDPATDSCAESKSSLSQEEALPLLQRLYLAFECDGEKETTLHLRVHYLALRSPAAIHRMKMQRSLGTIPKAIVFFGIISSLQPTSVVLDCVVNSTCDESDFDVLMVWLR